ncbi:Hypothetical predicted protein, partial [Pelobates cultripes]
QKNHVQRISLAGNTLQTPKALAEGFRQYYSSLYCLSPNTTLTHEGEEAYTARQKTYIEQNITTTLTPQDISTLEEDITEAEIRLAIKLAKLGKSQMDTR